MKQSEHRDLGLRVGVEIKRHRKREGLTQKALAGKALVTQAEVSLIESGDRSSLRTLDKVSHALNARLSDIIRFAEDVGDRASVVAEAHEFAQAYTGLSETPARQRLSP